MRTLLQQSVAAAALLLLSTTSSTTLAQVTTDNGEEQADCYSTTTSILMAQLQDPPVLDIVLCPFTVFSIGVPSDAAFTEFVGGDIPLTALHNDMTFACGNLTNPSSEQLCVLSGGLVQFTTQAKNPFWPSPVTTHNLKLQGLTFTGNLPKVDAGVSNQAMFFNAPGDNMLVEDCLFVDLTADYVIANVPGVLLADDAASTLYPPYSSTLTISNSVFQNVTWNGFALYNVQQTMHLQNSLMDNVEYSGNSSDANDRTLATIYALNGMTELVDNRFSNMVLSTPVVHVSDEEGGGSVEALNYNGNVADNVLLNENATGYCLGGLVVELESTNETAAADCVVFFDNFTPSPSSTPTIYTSPPPTVEQCFICGPSGTLINPEQMVMIDGPSSGDPLELSCQEIEDGLALLPPPFDTGACPAGARAAQLAGCQCEGVPTAAPVVPTLLPTRSPTVVPETDAPFTLEPTLVPNVEDKSSGVRAMMMSHLWGGILHGGGMFVGVYLFQ